MEEVKPFVHKASIVRRIWGSADTVLLIFAGASADFSVNRSVDWLYFTGKLPADPIGRLFSTIRYSGDIIFATEEKAIDSIKSITGIHRHVENARGMSIPNPAYRDVLYMLIYYSIASFELVDRPLDAGEKADVFEVFTRFGTHMHITGLHPSFGAWHADYGKQLPSRVEMSHYARDLYSQYRRHLGSFRFRILLDVQRMVTPEPVRQLLVPGRPQLLHLLLPFYRWLRRRRLHRHVMEGLVPRRFQAEVRKLNRLAPNYRD